MTRAEKVFKGVQARAALAGIEVVRTDPQDGPPRVFVQHGAAWRELRTVEDVESLVVQTAASTTAEESTA